MTGIRREKRNQESLGKNDAPGMMRIKGDKGHEGYMAAVDRQESRCEKRAGI